MPIDSALGRLGIKQGLCTSSTRPANPFEGQVIYESDTNRTLVYDNAAWVVVADSQLLSIDTTNSNVNIPSLKVNSENVTPYTGRRNLLYNGAMQVAQRRTSATGITGLDYYTADRWKTWVNGAGVFTQSVDSNAPDGYGSSLKMLCTTADVSPGSNDFIVFTQLLEGQDLQCLKKSTASAESLTLSFWVKSNVTGTYIVELYDIDNSGRTISASYTISSSDTWEYKTLNFVGDTAGSPLDNDASASLNLQFWLCAGATYSGGTLSTTWGTTTADRAAGQTNLASAINNYWQITGVQLELGNKATPFEHRSYGEELALCYRYYQKFVSDSSGPGVFAGGQFGGGTSTSRQILHFHVPMRTKATSVDFSAAGSFWINKHNVANYGVSAIGANTYSGNTPNSLEIGVTPSASAGAAGDTSLLVAANTTAYIGVSAEL